jgi:pSer/pThr/pTyr-binding forkhead associated (FHA) protein
MRNHTKLCAVLGGHVNHESHAIQNWAYGTAAERHDSLYSVVATRKRQCPERLKSTRKNVIGRSAARLYRLDYDIRFDDENKRAFGRRQ